MNKVLYLLFLNSFDFIIIVSFMNRLLTKKTSRYLSWSKIGYSIFSVTAANVHIQDNRLIFLINTIITIILLTNYDDSWLSKIVILVSILVLSLISEMISFSLIAFLFSEHNFLQQHNHFCYETGSLMAEALKLLFLLSISVIVTSYCGKRVKLPVKVYLLLFGIPLISIELLFNYMSMMISDNLLQNRVHIIVAMCSILVLNGLVVFLYDELSHVYLGELDKGLLNLNIEARNSYYAELERSVFATRKIRHDMNNHLTVLNALIKEKQLAEAQKYLSDIVSSIKEIDLCIYTSNQVLNYLLSEKISIATTKNIIVDIASFLPETFTIDCRVIATIFGNLLDNAIEACEKVDHPDQRINIKLKYRDKQVYIDISNTFNPKYLNKGFLTSKKDALHHGFGLKSVRKMVEENSGIINIYIEKNIFHVNIILWDL